MFTIRHFLVVIILCICVSPLAAQDVEYVSSILWTEVHDIEVVDNYAYCAFANGLVIIDFSNPGQPEEIGKLYLEGETRNLVVDGNYAYLAGSREGLQIVNIAVPSNPLLVSTFPTDNGEVYDVAKFGDYVCLADRYKGLCIVDVLIPDEPVEVFNWNITPLGDLFIHNNMLFAAGLSSGIYIFGLDNPYDPELIYSIVSFNWTKKVFVENNLLFFIDPLTGTIIYDITDPYLPQYQGIYPHGYFDLWVSGDYLYLTNSYLGISIIDVSDPTTPTLITDYIVSENAEAIFLDDDILYIANNWDGIEAVDVSTPSEPVQAGVFDIPQRTFDFKVAGSTIYAGGLSIIDITDIENPEVIGQINLPSSFGDLDISGNYAYVNNTHDDQLLIVEIANPTQPDVRAVYDTQGHLRDVKVDDGYAYIASDMGVDIVDISTPTEPQHAATFRITGEIAQEIYIRGDYMFLAYENAGLVIVDITDPTSPEFVSNFITSQYCRHVEVRDNYAYLASDNAYYIIDISDLSNPTQVIAWGTQDHVWNIYSDGDYAYLADTDLWICDISDLPNVYSVTRYPTPGWTDEIYVDGEYIFLADRTSVMILRFIQTDIDDDDYTIPTYFSLGQNYPNPFNAQTTISYEIPVSSNARIEIFDILGRKLETIVNKYHRPGAYSIIWNAVDLTSGVYLYKIQSGDYSETRKCLLLK